MNIFRKVVFYILNTREDRGIPDRWKSEGEYPNHTVARSKKYPVLSRVVLQFVVERDVGIDDERFNSLQRTDRE